VQKWFLTERRGTHFLANLADITDITHPCPLEVELWSLAETALTGNLAIMKTKSDEKLRWKVTTTLSNRETRSKVFLLLNLCGEAKSKQKVSNT